jgi:TetR/AcrR family transcriptional repressor of bet genes
MGRPSLGAERREQILEAFERCVATHGLEATTLEAVAAEAGVQRAAIRHFVGNRDELIAASVDDLTQKYRASYAEELRSLDLSGDRLGAIFDYLFLGGFVSHLSREGRATDALRAAAACNAEARKSLRRMYGAFEKEIFSELMAAYAGADPERARGIAYAIMCLAEEGTFMQAVGFPASRARAARDAAGLLVRSLGKRGAARA